MVRSSEAKKRLKRGGSYVGRLYRRARAHASAPPAPTTAATIRPVERTQSRTFDDVPSTSELPKGSPPARGSTATPPTAGDVICSTVRPLLRGVLKSVARLAGATAKVLPDTACSEYSVELLVGVVLRLPMRSA